MQIKIFTFFVLSQIFAISASAATFQTISSGSWTNAAIWTGNVPNVNNNDVIHIGTSTTGHQVILDGNLSVGNNVRLHIYSGSRLEITGNLTVAQSFEVNVHPGGVFIVSGNVSINATNTNQAATLTINGTASIGGNLTGYGTVQGIGTMTVAGTKGANIVDLGPLPVELLSFTAQQTQQQVILEWLTATETNNAGFVVERSADARNWENIGWVEGHGNANRMIRYQYLDRQPLQGINYYRLKQVDYDGAYEYHKIVALRVQKGTQAKIELVAFNQHELHIQLPAVSGQGQLILTDHAGNLIYQMSVQDNAYAQQVRIPSASFGAMVLVHFRDNQGTSSLKLSNRR